MVAQGGYSTAIRAHERFVFPIPEEIESRHAASMMCAGLTVFSPLKTHGCGPGKKVGIMGIGGLGHYAVLWAKGMGAEVYAFTHDESKMEDIKKMGADHVINTTKKVSLSMMNRAMLNTNNTVIGILERLRSNARHTSLDAGCVWRQDASWRLSLHVIRPRSVRHGWTTR